MFAKQNVRQIFTVTYMFTKQNARQTFTVTYEFAKQNVIKINVRCCNGMTGYSENQNQSQV
jgi:hypothetical protein